MTLNYPIKAIRALSDNYIWTICHPDQQRIIIVDPGDAEPVTEFIESNKLSLSAILITHHHWDHTNGALELKTTYHAPIYAPKNDPVKGADYLLAEPEQIQLAGWPIIFNILDIPAHTKGHIAYYSSSALFCGDTLFSAGCGRLFEGSAEQMLKALHKLAALPNSTEVYCAHEYTLNNLKFAQLVEPGNPEIQKYLETTQKRLAQNLPSLPSTIEIEKRCNPFLRCTQKEIVNNVSRYAGKILNSELEVFTYLRIWKDQF